MSNQRKQLRDERQKAEAYSRVMEQGLSDYSIAAEHRAELEKALAFSISDVDALAHARSEIQAMWDSLNECIPQAIRIEYEARRVTKSEEITGGRVM